MIELLNVSIQKFIYYYALFSKSLSVFLHALGLILKGILGIISLLSLDALGVLCAHHQDGKCSNLNWSMQTDSSMGRLNAQHFDMAAS